MVKLPSTKALRAFEATARLGSIKAAAELLCVSPSALGRQIQALEDELEQALFVRDPRGLSLTEAGREYAERLRAVFQSLSDATDAARANKPVRLRMLVPSMTMLQLMPRLKFFQAAHPGVHISIDAFPGVPNSDRRIDDADLVIFFGNGKYEGWDTDLLTPGIFGVPLCAPGYLDAPLDDPAELAAHTWIRTEHVPEIWASWCEAVGHPDLQPKHYFEVATALMGMEAARNCIGIWLGGGSRNFGVEPAIRKGELQLAHTFHAFLPELGYHLATRKGVPATPMIQACRSWVFEQCRLEEARVGRLKSERNALERAAPSSG
ncbi:transcriptional regulator GcvA [soil metagenome]